MLFFFQAEDGIRDFHVTGVQTCALPISDKKWWRLIPLVLSFGLGFVLLSLAMREIPMGTAYAIWTGLGAAGAVLIGILFFREPRSEERRVGKESRSRGVRRGRDSTSRDG